MLKPPAPSSLAQRTAVVTGGARGLGLAIAEALCQAGSDVALVDLLDGEAAARELAERTGRRVTYAHADVTDERSIQAAFDHVESALGTPDILVHCAGITSGTAALDLTAEEWNRLLSVNVTGTFLTNQAFARRHVDRSEPDVRASIVNVSSMSAFVVNVPQTQAAYNTSKAAVSMLTKSLAIEWLPLGIRVNAVAPGYFASDMTRDFVAANPRMAEEWTARIPSGRMGEPHELGPLVVYLAGTSSEYIVGQSIVIDGGYTVV